MFFLNVTKIVDLYRVTPCYFDGNLVCLGLNAYWRGGGTTSDLPYSLAQYNSLKSRPLASIDFDNTTPCMRYDPGQNKISDSGCSSNFRQFCVMSPDESPPVGLYNSIGESQVFLSLSYIIYSKMYFAVTPDYQGAMCSPPTNDAPAASNLLLDSYQPALMCPGRKANYVCNAGGLNIREVTHIALLY